MDIQLHHLVNGAHGRGVGGDRQLGAHAEGVDGRAVAHQVANRYSSRSPLAMILASVRPASSRMARTWRESAREVAAIQPHAPQRPARCGRPARAFERVVGIDELHRVLAQHALQLAEGFHLARE